MAKIDPLSLSTFVFIWRNLSADVRSDSQNGISISRLLIRPTARRVTSVVNYCRTISSRISRTFLGSFGRRSWGRSLADLGISEGESSLSAPLLSFYPILYPFSRLFSLLIPLSSPVSFTPSIPPFSLLPSHPIPSLHSLLSPPCREALPLKIS